VVVVLHLLVVVHQVLLAFILAQFVIDHLQVIVYNNMKKRVKKRIKNDVYLILQNNDYKEQKQQHFSEKEKVAKVEMNPLNLK
jgi:ABC-type bacteriocin/lantibiotic exporter with double-glycine peptidase domain